MTLDEFSAYCQSKPGVTADYPMKGDAVWLKVGGKLFAMTNVRSLKMDGDMVAPFHFINLKCDPARAVALRCEHAGIKPAWHQNKTHWNTLLMNPPLPDHIITELTDHSYDLVLASLPKKMQRALSI